MYMTRPRTLTTRMGYAAIAMLLAGLVLAPFAQAKIDRFGADGAIAPSAPYTPTVTPPVRQIGHWLLY